MGLDIDTNSFSEKPSPSTSLSSTNISGTEGNVKSPITRLPPLYQATPAVLERTPFAIDDPQEEEDLSDVEDGGVGDDEMMNEVWSKLPHASVAHLYSSRSMHSSKKMNLD